MCEREIFLLFNQNEVRTSMKLLQRLSNMSFKTYYSSIYRYITYYIYIFWIKIDLYELGVNQLKSLN